MTKKLQDERILESIDENKRIFFKKLLVGTVFAVPIMNSFSMDGLKVELDNKTARAADFGEGRGWSGGGGWGPTDSWSEEGRKIGGSGSGGSGSGPPSS